MPNSAHPELSPLVGSWRLLSVVSTFTDTKECAEPYGPKPEGWMTLEPGGRITFLFARRGRVPPASDEERVAMFNDLAAYTGRVRLDQPGKLVITVSLAKSPAWGGEVVRFFEIDGDRLIIRTPEETMERFPGRTITGEVTFEREHPTPS